jgi:hypothetical protein
VVEITSASYIVAAIRAPVLEVLEGAQSLHSRGLRVELEPKTPAHEVLYLCGVAEVHN